MIKPMLQSNESSLGDLQQKRPRGEGTGGQVVSTKKTADGKRWRCWEIIDEKRKKNGAKNDSCGTR